MMALALVLIAIPAAVAGWVGVPDVFNPFAELIRFGEHHEEHLHLGVAVAGTVAGLLGIGLATVMYWRPWISPSAISDAVPAAYRTLYNKYYFDEMYQWVIDRIILGLAGLAATFDRKVISDNVADRPAQATGALAGVLRYLQNGKTYSYALAFIVGIVLVIGMMSIWSSFNIRATLW
jgi:NADH-quinone oxidoreductase subunit L